MVHPCKFTVQTVLFPRSSMMTGVEAMMRRFKVGPSPERDRGPFQMQNIYSFRIWMIKIIYEHHNTASKMTTGQSGRGLKTTLERFRRQQIFAEEQQSPPREYIFSRIFHSFYTIVFGGEKLYISKRRARLT